MNGKIKASIIDRNLKLWPRDSLKQIKEVEIKFIEYESLRRGLVQCLSDSNTYKSQGECPRRPAHIDYLGFGVSGCIIIYENIHLTGNNLLVEIQRKWERIINMEICLNLVEYAFKKQKYFYRTLCLAVTVQNTAHMNCYK